MASDLADRAGGALSKRKRGASGAGEVMGAPRAAFTVVRRECDPPSLKGMGYGKKHGGEFVVHRNLEMASCYEIVNF
jgi:hypothetical protein